MVYLLTENLRAHARICENFQQQRVGNTAVHNGHAVDSAGNRIQRAIDLGQHAFTDCAVGN